MLAGLMLIFYGKIPCGNSGNPPRFFASDRRSQPDLDFVRFINRQNGQAVRLKSLFIFSVFRQERFGRALRVVSARFDRICKLSDRGEVPADVALGQGQAEKADLLQIALFKGIHPVEGDISPRPSDSDRFQRQS